MWFEKIFLLFNSLIQTILTDEVNNELVNNAMKVFQIEHPVIWKLNNTLSSKFLMKQVFLNGHYCQFANEDFLQRMNNKLPYDTIIMAEKNEDIMEEVLKSLNIAVVFYSENFDFQKFSTKVKINMKVFFIEISTNEVFEAYVINNHRIWRKLGRFQKHGFIWESNVEKDFILRRSDFHGLSLKAMTTNAGDDSIVNYKENATYFKNNETYLVTNFTSGKFYDILISLESHLNFTTNLYQRSDNGWGNVYPQANGSFHATGMVGDLFFGRADLIVSSLSVLYQRALYIDYLIPIAPDRLGLFIPSGHSKGQFQFNVFLLPFRYFN